MGFFARLGTLFKSNINEMISKAEDPEKMLNQVVVDMRNQLGRKLRHALPSKISRLLAFQNLEVGKLQL